MAKRGQTEGEDMLSPEMQAKMQAAKKLQDELNAKLSQFGQIASQKNASSVKEYEDLEKELLELKKYAATVKNENDSKLNDMINAMNRKMEKMAKTALEEQGKAAQNYQKLVADIKTIIDKLLALIDTFDVPEAEKKEMKSTFVQFHALADAKTKEVEHFKNDIAEMHKKLESSERAKLTKEHIGPKIDDLLEKLRATKQTLIPAAGPHGAQGKPAVVVVPIVQKQPPKGGKGGK